MRTGTYNLAFFLSLSVVPFCAAVPWKAPALLTRTAVDSNPITGPNLRDQESPVAPAGDNSLLGAQIGGIVGSYAVSLVLVAIGLLALSKRRREHLRAGEDPDAFLQAPTFQFPESYPKAGNDNFPYPLQTPKSPYRNFSYPDPLSPTRTERTERSEVSGYYVYPSPTSTILAPGVDLAVDQSIVAQDRDMAQQQLEDMYKYVMEQEEAKEEGREYEGPPLPSSPQSHAGTPGSPASQASHGILKKERNKPANLDLGLEEKKQSRTSSILSILKSPRKKNMKGVSISSPIMTPMSGTFPRQEGSEMNPIPPRQYAPAPPPPVPSNQLPFRRNASGGNLPLTPEMSPTSVTSIDGRLDAALAQPLDTKDQPPAAAESSHSRHVSAGTSGTNNEPEPVSAASTSSTSALVGLPTSPKPGVTRFPSLPASPKPGQTFQRSNAPAPVRTGGSLPFRAYEPSIISPRQQTTKETVFTRAMPMSPGMQTPFTGAAVPYSPYQPFSPVVPITPSLVTKADRKRMKRLEPKTPTVEMVKNTDDIW